MSTVDYGGSHISHHTTRTRFEVPTLSILIQPALVHIPDHAAKIPMVCKPHVPRYPPVSTNPCSNIINDEDGEDNSGSGEFPLWLFPLPLSFPFPVSSVFFVVSAVVVFTVSPTIVAFTASWLFAFGCHPASAGDDFVVCGWGCCRRGCRPSSRSRGFFFFFEAASCHPHEGRGGGRGCRTRGKGVQSQPKGFDGSHLRTKVLAAARREASFPFGSSCMLTHGLLCGVRFFNVLKLKIK